MRRILTTTFNWEEAAVQNGIILRSTSLPVGLNTIKENALFGGYDTRVSPRQRSLSESNVGDILEDISLSSCSWSIDKKKEDLSPNLANDEASGKKSSESMEEEVVIEDLKVMIDEIILKAPDNVLQQRGATGPSTPKRTLKFSPDTPRSGRKGLVEMDNAGSPILRKRDFIEDHQMEEVTRPRANSLDKLNLVERLMVQGRRRANSLSVKPREKKKGKQMLLKGQCLISKFIDGSARAENEKCSKSRPDGGTEQI